MPERTRSLSRSRKNPSSSPRNNQMRPSSTVRRSTSTEPSQRPIYIDLAYVPQHADSNYSDVDFFRYVRAKYYVYSGISPCKETLEALIEAKKTWPPSERKMPVTVIPTHDTESLGYWMAENEQTLANLNIEVAPSANRCTVTLQGHETSCSAYRVEF